MNESEFRSALEQESGRIGKARDLAFSIHDSVGQKYGSNLPYGHHLQMVADYVMEYGHSVCMDAGDVLPMVFGAFFHDTMEDARQSYNDVRRSALQIGMSEGQALTAAEIVYALTNEKGRTREERQSEKYYQGIRGTPYAPLVKMADRLANTTFSCSSSDGYNQRMKCVYAAEWPRFLSHIRVESGDIRFSIPDVMVERMEALF